MDITDPPSPACETLVRTQDSDRYAIGLFYAPPVRAHLWALYAFNHEIARTREVVTDTHIGLIRLQWWRDSLDAFYTRNHVPAHDIMRGLADAIWRHDLPREVFDNLLYAREFDLEDQAPGSLAGLCNYADYTHTPLLRLAAMVVEENPDDPALRPVAMAYALAGLIRAVPFHAAQGRSFLPDDLVRRAGGADPARLPPVITAIRREAEDLLRQAPLDKAGRLVRLHAAMAGQYLNKIKKLRDDCYDPRLRMPPVFRAVGLWRAAKINAL